MKDENDIYLIPVVGAELRRRLTVGLIMARYFASRRDNDSAFMQTQLWFQQGNLALAQRWMEKAKAVDSQLAPDAPNAGVPAINFPLPSDTAGVCEITERERQLNAAKARIDGARLCFDQAIKEKNSALAEKSFGYWNDAHDEYEKLITAFERTYLAPPRDEAAPVFK